MGTPGGQDGARRILHSCRHGSLFCFLLSLSFLPQPQPMAPASQLVQQGGNSPSWGPAPYKPPLPISPSPPPQPRARGAVEGLRGFPPNLRPHVPARIPVECSPHGSRHRFSHPGLGALPGPVCGSRFVRLSPRLAAETVGAGAAHSPLNLHPCPGPRQVLKRLPPLPDVPRAFPGWGSPGSSSG